MSRLHRGSLPGWFIRTKGTGGVCAPSRLAVPKCSFSTPAGELFHARRSHQIFYWQLSLQPQQLHTSNKNWKEATSESCIAMGRKSAWCQTRSKAKFCRPPVAGILSTYPCRPQQWPNVQWMEQAVLTRWRRALLTVLCTLDLGGNTQPCFALDRVGGRDEHEGGR